MTNKPTQPVKVVIAEAIAQDGIDALAAHSQVIDLVGADRTDILNAMTDASAIIVRSATKVDREMIDAAPSLKVIGRAGIGTDNIDVEAATERGIMVVNAPHANTISAAEHTMALILAQARRVAEADRSLRGGKWERSSFQGIELHGKTLGVLGLGKIGTLVAQRASAFGMRITAFDPYVSEDRARRLGIEMMDLPHILATADVITVHLPRTPKTENLINAETIAGMKDGARVVNVARGGIVNEQDLADAVSSGKLGGAAVDVFDTEPTTDSPLFGVPQVTVTPHLGASTKEAQGKAGIAVAESVAAALQGDLVLSAVNLDLGPAVSARVLPFIELAENLGKIFTAISKGLPSELIVTVRGDLAEEPTKPLALSALKGALASSSEVAVSYVNTPLIAEARGVSVIEESQVEIDDYQSTVRISGTVNGTDRTVAGTVMARKGPVLVGLEGYAIEVPLTRYMLLVRNADVPGCIGRVGTYLGEIENNIADMVVGRGPDDKAAMMGIALDGPLGASEIEGLLALNGIEAARFVDLS